jgi:hypothetical protein
MTYSTIKNGTTYKQEINKLKATPLVPNYNTANCGSIAITKVRVRLKTLAGIDLDCDPGCSGTC